MNSLLLVKGQLHFNLVLMAENLTLNNGAINDLYLTNGITKGGLLYLIITIVGHCNIIMLPLFIITLLYMFTKVAIKIHVEECMYCTDPTPTGTMCEQSKTKKVRFCRIIERWTVWLLVDLFRTPNVGKEMDNSKVHLKLWEKRTLVVGKKVLRSAGLFACISFIFCLYIQRFLVDFFQKLTPTCISKGDFEVYAACYSSNTRYSSHITPQTSYQINCTTWNNNLESLGEEIGLLSCFSFHFNILTSVTEIMGMFELHIVGVRLTLNVAEKCTPLVDKYTQRMTKQICKQCCIAIRIPIISGVSYIFITYMILVLIVITDPMNTKRIDEALYQQVLPMQIAYLSMMLGIFLILLTDKDEKTTEETRNTRDCDKNEFVRHCTNKCYPRKANSSMILTKSFMLLTDKDDETTEETRNTSDRDEELLEEGTLV